jgi:hypothetical protein
MSFYPRPPQWHEHVLGISMFKSLRYPLRSRRIELTRGLYGNYTVIETLGCCEPFLLLLHRKLEAIRVKPATFGDYCSNCKHASPYHVFTDIIVKDDEMLKQIRAFQEWRIEEPHQIVNLQLHRPAHKSQMCCQEAPAVFFLSGRAACDLYGCETDVCLFRCSVDVKIKQPE